MKFIKNSVLPLLPSNTTEEDLVANAIAEHYSPAGPADECPTAPTSVAVSLAEKVDTLAGFWLIDEKPTGSKDPFALRRAALGVIRLVSENGLRLPLGHVFAEQFGLHAEQNLIEVSSTMPWQAPGVCMVPRGLA